MSAQDPLLDMMADIVSAYVSHNEIEAEKLPELLTSVHQTLTRLNQDPEAQAGPKPIPAVPIEESLHEDYLICLEDGELFKSLKRHLRTKFNLTPAQYREKWGLPKDYPMVAPSYARQRSQLAKKMGLGKGTTESGA